MEKEKILLFLFFMENDNEKITKVLKYFNLSNKDIKFLIALKDFCKSTFN
jgi:hypothetical protein